MAPVATAAPSAFSTIGADEGFAASACALSPSSVSGWMPPVDTATAQLFEAAILHAGQQLEEPLHIPLEW